MSSRGLPHVVARQPDTEFCAVIYARVSSKIQRDRQTIESQLETLSKYVEERGWALGGVYKDDGKSAKTGKLSKRAGWLKLCADAEAGKFNTVVVYDLDRVARTERWEERGQILGP